MPAAIAHGTAPSTRQALVRVLRDAMAAHPEGLTLPAWRAAAARVVALTPSRFGGHVQSLRTTGLIRAVGGRIGHQRYAPADWTVPTTAPEPEIGLQVLAALRRAEAAAGGPVPVGIVRATLRADGVECTALRCRQLLNTFARPRRRGDAALIAPVHKQTVRGAAGHRLTVWSTQPPEMVITPAPTRAEALRQLVQASTAHTGMALSTTWLRAWQRAHGAADWPPAWRRDLRRLLVDTARRPQARLEQLTHPWVTTPRFALPDSDPVALAAGRLEDFALRADVAAEWEALTALTRQVRQRPRVAAIIDRRQRLLAACLHETLQGVALRDALARWTRANVIREPLVGTALKHPWRALVRQHASMTALAEVLTPAPWPDRPPVLGEAGLMEPEAVDRWVRAWAMAIGAVDTDASRERALAIMRRVAGVIVAGELRFDALRAVLALVPYARTPRLHQQLLARLRDRGMLDRDPKGTDVVEGFCSTGHWRAVGLPVIAARRLRLGGWFGVLE